MGFFFRKSVGFGPFRLNFSKSGIGASFGVRGARVSTGPRGTYINVGRGGFYYRQKIGSSPNTSSDAYAEADNVSPKESPIDSADVAELVDSSSEELLNQINACARRIRYAPILAILCIVIGIIYMVAASNANGSARQEYSVAADAARDRSDAAEKAFVASNDKKLKANERKKTQEKFKSLDVAAKDAEKIARAKKKELDDLRHRINATDIFFLILSAIGVVGIVFVHRRDEFVRQKPVTYALDDFAKARLKILDQGCTKLAEARRLWRVDTQQTISDWKRNAGAQALISRSECQIGKASPPNIKTNLVPWAITCNDVRLFIFPDHIFVLQRGRYGVLSYKFVSVDLTSNHFRETDGVPSDAVIAGYTWQYVRKDGGPDQRFANNRQVPIAVYTQIDIRSPQGFHVRLQISNEASAVAFVAALKTYGSDDQQRYDQSRTEHEPKSRQFRGAPPPDKTEKSAFEVLGVTPRATQEEIRAAYYRMAQQYHPDKVATLAPEFRELAERRMKEINAAYEKLQS